MSWKHSQERPVANQGSLHRETDGTEQSSDEFSPFFPSGCCFGTVVGEHTHFSGDPVHPESFPGHLRPSCDVWKVKLLVEKFYILIRTTRLLRNICHSNEDYNWTYEAFPYQ
ncbi:uncharacterized protein LOC126584335 [Malus sylvestris]|uniref:uncharacterized protein LOC126584335 n=1 Tax=Malus sylvestris TaxID=3752 RepID=UPI0021AD0013|nr:uncharacterized protein LOC126584335 [Malus sylvestris]